MLIKKIFLALSLGILSLGVAFADADPAEVSVVASISASISAINQPQLNIWPGLAIKEPVLIYLQNGNTYAVNKFIPWGGSWYQTATYYNHWTKLNFPTGSAATDMDYFFVRFYNLFKPSWGWVEREAQEVYVYTPPEMPISEVSSHFMYHYFKRYEQQRSPGFQAYITEKQKNEELNKTKPAYTDVYQQSNIELMYLALKALEDYATHHNLQALKYYAAINQVRLSTLQADSVAYEKNDALLSGTAQYVSWKSQNESEQLYFEKTFSTLNIPEITVPFTYSFAQYLPRYLKPIAKFAKHFNRYVTPLVGSGLDELYKSSGIDPSVWKNEAEEKHISASESLQNYYKMTMADANSLVAVAKNLYGFDQNIAPNLDKILGSYQQTMQAELQNYQNQPGVEVTIVFPNKMHHPYTHGLRLPIDNQAMLQIDSTGAIQDVQYKAAISYTKIPYVIVRDVYFKHHAYTTLTFKLQSQELISFGQLNGKKVSQLAATAYTSFSGSVNLNSDGIKTDNLYVYEGSFQGSDGGRKLKIIISKFRQQAGRSCRVRIRLY